MALIRTRKQWGAAPAKSNTAGQADPTEAFIHHTENATGGRHLSVVAMDAAMRSIQQFHQQTRGWADVGYHYVVFQGPTAGVSRVYAGRPASVVPAAQLGHNTGTLAIAVYAGGEDELEAHTRWTVEQVLRRHDRIVTVGTHRQVTSTDCPGDVVAGAVPTIARAAGLRVYRDGRGL